MNSTIIIGIASIALALVFRSQAHDLPLQAQRLPNLLIWLVLALAVLMIVEDVLKRRAARKGDAAVFEDDEPLAPINWGVLAAFGSAAIAYVALIPLLGYLIVTPLLLSGGLMVSKTQSPGRSLLVGGLATLLVWAVFIWMLNLPVQLLPSFI